MSTSNEELPVSQTTGEQSQTDQSGETNGNGNGEDNAKTTKKKKNSKFQDFMLFAHNLVTVTLAETEILALVSPYTYTPEKFQEATAFKQAIEDSFVNRETALAKQKALTQDIHGKRREAQPEIDFHVGIGQAVFSDDQERLDALLLEDPAFRNQPEWLLKNKLRYRNFITLPGVADAMALHGVTLEALQGTEQKILAMEAAIGVRQAAKGEVQRITAAKNKILRQYKKWVRDYLKVVDVALQAEPELKEKLGVKVPFSNK